MLARASLPGALDCSPAEPGRPLEALASWPDELGKTQSTFNQILSRCSWLHNRTSRLHINKTNIDELAADQQEAEAPNGTQGKS